MNRKPDLYDLYRINTNVDGSITIDIHERLRFEQNFNNHLTIMRVCQHNDFAKETYEQLVAYCRWYEDI